MSQLVTIFGGNGFIGRYVAQRMARAGWRVRVACRRPNEAMFVKPYGTVGQVEPIFCNIRDDASVAAALAGADAVVNCVGTFETKGANNCHAVQGEGAGRIARLASEGGVARLVHISSIGADVDADSDYCKSKGAGEAAVQEAFQGAVILRPSVVFGPEDEFFNRFAAMARMTPVLPLFGADTKFQPVYVDDVAAAAEAAVLAQAEAGVYELGGPDVASFRDLIGQMLEVTRRKALIVNLPFWIGNAVAHTSRLASFLSLGIVKQPVTVDQLKSLRDDNVVSDGAKGLSDLGVRATSMASVLPEYLWQFRPSGQYAALKESAKNLR